MKLVLGTTASPLVSRARSWGLEAGSTGSRAHVGLLMSWDQFLIQVAVGFSGPKVYVGLLLSRTWAQLVLGLVLAYLFVDCLLSQQAVEL